MALRTAFFALMGLEMARLGTAATLLTIWHTAIKHDVWALVLVLPAVAGIVLAVVSLREVAEAIASRRPPAGRP